MNLEREDLQRVRGVAKERDHGREEAGRRLSAAELQALSALAGSLAFEEERRRSGAAVVRAPLESADLVARGCPLSGWVHCTLPAVLNLPAQTWWVAPDGQEIRKTTRHSTAMGPSQSV